MSYSLGDHVHLVIFADLAFTLKPLKNCYLKVFDFVTPTNKVSIEGEQERIT